MSETPTQGNGWPVKFAPEIPGDRWADETVCPNCKGRDVVEFAFRVAGSPSPPRSCLECRDCGAYSTWRLTDTDAETRTNPGSVSPDGSTLDEQGDAPEEEP